MHAVTKHNTVNRNLSKVTFVFKLVRPAFFMQGVIWYVVVLISLLFRHSKWTQSLKFVNITQPHVTASLIFKLEYSSRYSFFCVLVFLLIELNLDFLRQTAQDCEDMKVLQCQLELLSISFLERNLKQCHQNMVLTSFLLIYYLIY